MNLPKTYIIVQAKTCCVKLWVENKLQKVQIFNYCTDIFGVLEVHVGWVITVNAYNTINNPTLFSQRVSFQYCRTNEPAFLWLMKLCTLLCHRVQNHNLHHYPNLFSHMVTIRKYNYEEIKTIIVNLFEVYKQPRSEFLWTPKELFGRCSSVSDHDTPDYVSTIWMLDWELHILVQT